MVACLETHRNRNWHFSRNGGSIIVRRISAKCSMVLLGSLTIPERQDPRFNIQRSLVAPQTINPSPPKIRKSIKTKIIQKDFLAFSFQLSVMRKKRTHIKPPSSCIKPMSKQQQQQQRRRVNYDKTNGGTVLYQGKCQ